MCAILVRTVCVSQPKIDTICLPTQKVRELVTYKEQKRELDKKVIELNNTVFLLNANAVDYMRQVDAFRTKDSINNHIQAGFTREILLKNDEIKYLTDAVKTREKWLRKEKNKKKTVSFLALAAIGAVTYLYITK